MLCMNQHFRPGYENYGVANRFLIYDDCAHTGKIKSAGQ